ALLRAHGGNTDFQLRHADLRQPAGNGQLFIESEGHPGALLTVAQGGVVDHNLARGGTGDHGGDSVWAEYDWAEYGQWGGRRLRRKPARTRPPDFPPGRSRPSRATTCAAAPQSAAPRQSPAPPPPWCC